MAIVVVPSSAEPWAPPDEFEEYRLLSPLGRGGMGQVWLAHDSLLDRQVAVKFIAGVVDEEARERFVIEARAAARLAHPNVVSVFRVGTLEGRPFLVSEYVRGKTMLQLKPPLASAEVLTLGIGLARGLAAAHRRGVLHRDIKPGNAMVAEDGAVKLLDFGLAKLIDIPFGTRTDIAMIPASGARELGTRGTAPDGATAMTLQPGAPQLDTQRVPIDLSPHDTLRNAGLTSDRSENLTEKGVVVGTPYYLAPEVFRGEPATRRSDVYSLGILLFEMAAGRPPFRDVPFANLGVTVCRVDPAPIAQSVPDIEPRLAAVIDRAIKRRPAERFGSGDELREALEAIHAQPRVALALPEGNPYRGLLPFDAEHRGLYFGRSGEVRSLLDRLRAEPFVLVVGDSGVGKTSLCRAGVLPRVAEGALGSGRAWSVVTVTPGRRPLASLADALSPVVGRGGAELLETLRADPAAIARELRQRSSPTAGILIFIDQLEELVTLASPDEAGALGELLGALAMGLPDVRVLGAVRSGMLTRLAPLPGLGDELTRAIYILRPLSNERLREAILKPAEATGVRFESDALVDELLGSKGGLPVLQFALSELWEARDVARQMITASALAAMGGVGGALVREAEEVIHGLLAPAREGARRILTRLVGPQGELLRRPETELIEQNPARRPVLDALVRGRVLMTREGDGEPTYELVHESLVTAWPTLREWLDVRAETRAVRHRLELAVREWKRLAGAKEALWGVAQLADTSGLKLPELGEDERAFLLASRKSVRGSRVRLALALAVLPAAALATWGILRFDESRTRSALVRAEQGTAEIAIQSAQEHARKRDALASESFATFDGGNLDKGEAIWTDAQAAGAAADQAYAELARRLEKALAVVGESTAIRGLLADALLERALLAERQHRPELATELIARLAIYDKSGEHRRAWDVPGQLDVKTEPPGAHVVVEVVGPPPARSVARAIDLGTSPASAGLPHGSYIVVARLPGRAEVRLPILIGRGEKLQTTLPLPEESSLPAGFAYVPQGRFLVGSSEDDSTRREFFHAPPLHQVETGAYLIARHETTFEDWINFLETLPVEERARRTPRVEGNGFAGTLGLEQNADGVWTFAMRTGATELRAREGETVHYEDRNRNATQVWTRFPVAGIVLGDIEAYLEWLRASGRVPGARMCTELEWERAARGADGRRYPHGDALTPDDANYDRTYGSKLSVLGPDAVGLHPRSRSPFGVDDMAGNTWEWVTSSRVTSSLEEGDLVVRGGGFSFTSTVAVSYNREPADTVGRDITLGLRVCAAVQ